MTGMTLNDWMLSEGRTREWVAAQLGVSVVSVGRYLTGARKPRDPVMLLIKRMTNDLVTADAFLMPVKEAA